MIWTAHKHLTSASDGIKTGDGTGVGFFIPLNPSLAAQFPSLGEEDRSPPHVTFLYVGNVPKDREAQLVAVANTVFQGWIRGHVTGQLTDMEYFEQPAKDRRVAVMQLRFSHDMTGLRWRLRDALQEAGFVVDDSFPLIYRPHTTLAYLDGIDAIFDGSIPQGSWDFDGIEVWGMSKVYTAHFDEATRTVAKVASRHIDAMRHEVSVELMKFLSAVARKLGVANHVYVVGGAVRNFVIKEPIKDIDVVIDSVALGRGRDSEWFAKELQRVIPTNTNLTINNYGVAILTISGDWEVAGQNLNEEVIEIANARTESYAPDTYKPDDVAPATIVDDTYRREFSFNTLLWRMHDLANGPDKAEILDLTGCGLKDLHEGVMRCPSSPDKTFGDDPSRMIRAIKFLLKYGFKIAPDVEASIKRNKEKIRNIPGSHLSHMLITLFYETGVGKRALVELDKLGILDVIRSIATTDKPFREALANWAERKADVSFLFDLMDLGMPVGKSMGFLNPAQKSRVREITVEMTADEGATFLAVLEQPGKVIDMPGLIEEFGLKGAQIRDLMLAARIALLDDPVLVASPRRWEARIRTGMGKTASDGDDDRNSRMQAAKHFPENLLPNVHEVVPARYMAQVPYRDGMREITIYRSVPQGVTEIRPGDWVTLTRSYAQTHGRGTILTKKVPVGHVYWAGTDMNEWFYTPVGHTASSPRLARIKIAIDTDESFQIIDFVRGYKQITGVRRIPIARNTNPKTGEVTIVVGNEDIDKYKLRIAGKDYLTDAETAKLFHGEVVIEEKVDGHPVVVLYGGYTFFCESLNIRHTVEYDKVPYSEGGWPNMTVVYEVMDGENAPPYRHGEGTGKWLTRDEKESICSIVGAPLAPLVFKGVVKPEDLPQLADRLSSFGSGTAEGIVVKNLRTGVFGKFINMEFQKAIAEEDTWGGVHPELRGIRNVRKFGKTFTINEGDPVLFGKWKNKRGLIRDFGVSDKGDPTITVVTPTGKEQVINLFKIREPQAPVPTVGDVTADLAGHMPEYQRLTQEYNVMNRTSEDDLEAQWASLSYQDHLPGGLGDKATPKDFDPKQVAKGKKVEIEHTDDPDTALEIVMDHLTEDPAYYDKLETIEKDAKDLFGPRTPLMDVKDTKVTYRIKASSEGILAAVYSGKTRIGAMDAYPFGVVDNANCSADILKLLDKYPELEDTSTPRWVAWGKANPRIEMLSVSHADVYDESLRGLGIGKAMYLAVAAEWFDRKGPFLFMSDECGPIGSTSPAARRVWDSLAKTFPSSGRVIAFLKRPTLPANMRMAGKYKVASHDADTATRVATRPISLDREQTDNILHSFQTWAGRQTAQLFGDTNGFLTEITLPSPSSGLQTIQVAFFPGDESNSMVQGGGFGRHPVYGPVVKIWINPTVSLKILASKPEMLKAMRPVLMHELTHAIDRFPKGIEHPRNNSPIGLEEVDSKGYFNDPAEVRAHMRELYEEIHTTVQRNANSKMLELWGMDKIILGALNATKTWRDMEPHLSRLNRNRILKGLWTAFEDESLVKTAADAKFTDKKEVKKQDGGTMTVYEYSDQHIDKRNKAKAEQVEKLRGNIDKLRTQYRKDLKEGLK